MDHNPGKDAAKTATLAYLQKPASGQGQESTPSAPAIPRRQQPKIIEDALKFLVSKYERECDRVRRNHLRRMLEGEEFWKGNHYPVWSETAFSFRTPFEQFSYLRERKPEAMPTRIYITNLYRAHGASVISVLSEKLPKVRFLPKNAESQKDIATAKAASSVADLIERNNNLTELVKYEAYLLWTQGIFGSYVRYVLDSDFGTHDEPIIEQKQIQVTPDEYRCPQCGQANSASDASMLPYTTTMQCPQCGTPMTDSDFYPAEYAQAPVVTGTAQLPDGQEVISVYGGVHLKLMPWAHTQRESGYLILAEEQPIGMVRSAYPWEADRITEGSGETGGGEFNAYEHIARQRLYDAAQPYGNRLTSAMNQGTVTYKRCWLRNWALHAHPDQKIRASLIEAFPNGVFCAFAGEAMVEVREENMDDHWQIGSAMPSQGIYADALGQDTIPMNKVIDDNLNLMKEQMEFGAAPPVAVDARYINAEALTRRRMRAGSYLPVALKRDGGKTLRDLFWQPQINIDSSIYGHTESLIELTQLISAALPSIFGGQMPANQTASGYNMSRQGAMGRIQMWWNSMRVAHAQLMLKAVNVFRENRTEDAILPILDDSKEYVNEYIKLGELSGNITAMPETDEDFPASWAEKRENLINLLKLLPEWAQTLLQDPSNSPTMRRLLADPDIVFPMEAAREKQYREIDQLMREAPAPIGMNPDGSIQFRSTVQVNMDLDDHAVEMLTIKSWANSDKGIMAAKQKPEGFANVWAHYQEHQRAAIEQQAKLQSTGAQVMGEYGILPQPPPSKESDAATPTPQQETPEPVAAQNA